MNKRFVVETGKSVRSGREEQRAKGPKGARKESKWFRGEHTNLSPKVTDLIRSDAAQEYILKGWAPEKPLIEQDTKIVAFGSCFAANIANWLADRNYALLTKKDEESGVYIVDFGEGMVNTYVLRQQFEWALEGREFSEELWHGKDAEAVGYDEGVRAQTRDMFMSADLFIITLGLSEIWYDEPSGDVFWRAVPRKKYDPERHKFRVASVQENRENIEEIVRIIRKHRPDTRIIFTVSPIPLAATFRPTSIMSANSASKASIRAAVDEAFRGDMPEEVYYWPSYELVMDQFDDRWRLDRRHIRRWILEYVMTLFEETWCKGDKPEVNSAERLMIAKSFCGPLHIRTPWLMERGLTPALSMMAKKFEAQEKVGHIDLLIDAARAVAERVGGARGRRLTKWAEKWTARRAHA